MQTQEKKKSETPANGTTALAAAPPEQPTAPAVDPTLAAVATAAASTAIAKPEPIADPGDGGALNAFSSASNFATAQRMALALSQSTLVPEIYRGNVPNCLIAIELASRMDRSVFAIMQNMSPVMGKPAWASTFLIGSVNASGKFTPIRWRWQGQEGQEGWGCRAVATDLRTGEECLGALITMALVKAEGWYSRNGSKWKTMPEQMFMYRSAAFWVRAYAPEMTLGIRSADEIEDIGGVDGPAPGGLAPLAADPSTNGRRMPLGQRAAAPIQDAVTVPAATPAQPPVPVAAPPTAAKPARAQGKPQQQTLTPVAAAPQPEDEEDRGDAPSAEEMGEPGSDG